ncbi:MAG: hypothetical protein ACLUQB_07340, partial [Lachnospiraceae bacterium]
PAFQAGYVGSIPITRFFLCSPENLNFRAFFFYSFLSFAVSEFKFRLRKKDMIRTMEKWMVNEK